MHKKVFSQCLKTILHRSIFHSFLAYFATKITKLKNETFFGDFPTLFRGPTFFARNLHASRGELVQGRMASHYFKTKYFVQKKNYLLFGYINIAKNAPILAYYFCHKMLWICQSLVFLGGNCTLNIVCMET